MKKTALAILVLSVMAHGQGICKRDIVLSKTTTYAAYIVPYANIRVCLEGDRANPCATPQALYADSALTRLLNTPSQGLWNIRADIDGNYGYCIAPGTYSEQISSGTRIVNNGPITLGGLAAVIERQPVDMGYTYNAGAATTSADAGHSWPFAVTFPAGCANCTMIGEDAATAETTFTLSKCTGASCTTIGTAVFGAGSNKATITFSTQVVFNACVNATAWASCDHFEIVAPGVADTTLRRVRGTFYGTRAGGVQ